ncbi:MAG: hypothetical protein H6633_10975 [Anaerolineales bacterium]|nr:hypothetical protein [Anaerolineales bacterium]
MKQVININRALKSERLLKALTGVSVAEFNTLPPSFDAAVTKSKREQKTNRKRAEGGGRKHTLLTSQHQLFFILFYLKCYPTFDLAGFFLMSTAPEAGIGSRSCYLFWKNIGLAGGPAETQDPHRRRIHHHFPRSRIFSLMVQNARATTPKGKAQRKHYSGKQKSIRCATWL